MGMPILAFFLLLLIFQLFFMPDLVRQGGQLYVPFKKIVVGGTHNNPPYEFLDENNEPAGYNVDLTRAIAAEMKTEVEIRLGDKSEIFREFIDGKIDLLQGVTQSDSIVEEHPFYSHIAYSQKLFSTTDHPEKITTLAQLSEGELFLSKNNPLISDLIERYPKINFHQVSSHSEALRKLAEGVADYALIINLPSLYLDRELVFLGQGRKDAEIIQIGELYPVLGYGYLARDDDALLPQINMSLNNLKLSGRQKEIQEQWLGKRDHGQISKRDKSVQLGGLIFSPLLLIVCSVFFWNHSLQKEIERRSKELAVQQLQLIQADKMTSLGILVAGVAHEINNPAGLLLHNLSTLKKIQETTDAVLRDRFQQEGDFFVGGLPYSVLREESPQIISEMKEGVNHIIQIVEDLKDFSRQDSTNLLEDVDLNTVVMGFTQAARQLTEETDIQSRP